MATFLTTTRMHPALRARIERSVTQRAKTHKDIRAMAMPRAFAKRGKVSIGRLIPLVAVGIVAVLFGTTEIHDRRATEDRRAMLLATLEAHRLGMSPSHRDFLDKTERWVTELAKDPWPGDTVLVDHLGGDKLDAWLTRPAVYLRGAGPELREPATIPEAATTSQKDAFLLCLLRPPSTPDTKAILSKVRGVNFGGAKVDVETKNVRLFLEASLAMAVLDPAFEANVRTADSIAALRRLEKDVEAAPIDAAKAATRAELLIVVVDEVEAAQSPPVRGGTPLGYRAQERPHDARVALVDLTSERALLRIRRHVDASGRDRGATLANRASVEGCALALDVRSAAGGPILSAAGVDGSAERAAPVP